MEYPDGTLEQVDTDNNRLIEEQRQEIDRLKHVIELQNRELNGLSEHAVQSVVDHALDEYVVMHRNDFLELEDTIANVCSMMETATENRQAVEQAILKVLAKMTEAH